MRALAPTKILKKLLWGPNGLKTRLNKKRTFSILLRRPWAQDQALSPRPRPRACEEGWKIYINGAKIIERIVKKIIEKLPFWIL